MTGHHLILGKLTDFLTGETLDDTLDERYRQKLARILVNQKGYSKADIISRRPILISAGTCKARLPLDFQISISSRVGMIIKYGPGSIVTRYRPALALSRIIEPHQIPVVVVTNGETAEILNGDTGQVISDGFDSIPTRDQLKEILADLQLQVISQKRFEMESRILYAFEIDGACPCDDTICKI